MSRPTPHPPAPRSCSACGRGFEPGAALVRVNGLTLHQGCFACSHCGSALSKQVYPSGKSGLACYNCHLEHHCDRCRECRKPIAPGSKFVVFREQKIHPECFRCASCGCSIEQFHEKAGKPYCSRCEIAQFGEKCAACKKPLADATTRHYKFVTLNGRKIHPGCLRCDMCAKQLSSSGFYEKDGRPFCAEHYAETHGKRCAICAKALLTWSMNGWGEVYCVGHEKDFPQCHGCGRLVVSADAQAQFAKAAPASSAPGAPPSLRHRSGSGVDYDDGRSLCATCVPSAVHGAAQVEAVWAAVRAFFGRLGVCVPAASFPTVRLLDRNSLQDVATRTTRSFHSTQRCPLGVTCCNSSIVFSQTQRGSDGRQRVESDDRSVSQVACLSGLPEGYLSTVLAHELGHVVMHLQGFPTDLAPVVSEGVCELFSFLWLEGEGGHPGSDAERSYRIESLKRSQHGDIYSEGYRQALAAYYACGSSLTQVLQQVRRTRTLGPAVGRSPLRRQKQQT